MSPTFVPYSYVPASPTWPPRVPEARVSPPDEEELVGAQLLDALAVQLHRAHEQLRQAIVARHDPELSGLYDRFVGAWEWYEDEKEDQA